MTTIICKICGQMAEARTVNKVYCSRRCRQKAFRLGETRTMVALKPSEKMVTMDEARRLIEWEIEKKVRAEAAGLPTDREPTLEEMVAYAKREMAKTEPVQYEKVTLCPITTIPQPQ